ncbi:metallophosphoesterase [candidate division WOR-3 bacterium]|nr:metallophosphoesterase [candidate division WOR-3 bacterium]
MKLLLSLSLAFVSGFLYSEGIRFAVMGDRTGGHVEGVFEDALTRAQMLGPQFIINVGDLIEGYSEDESKIREEWNDILPYIRALSCPFFFTPGNHDITNEIQEKIYRELIGEPYYSFDRGGFHFIVLDNSRLESSLEYSPDQIEWLEEDLKKNTGAIQTFVFYHKPFWFETLSRGENEQLHDLFVQYGVDAVFTGHYHIYFSAEIDGIKYTGVGSSGAKSHLGILGPEYHFLLVTADKEGLNIAVISLDGVLSWDNVTVADIQFADRAINAGIQILDPLGIEQNFALKDAIARIAVRNLSNTQTILDTLKINVPEGWTASLIEKPLEIPPGDSTIFSVCFNLSGNLYPLPSLSLDYPVRKGMFFPLVKNISVRRSALCARAQDAVIIDGNIDELCWREPQRDFFSQGGVPSKTDGVEFYFAYDPENLYLSVKCDYDGPNTLITSGTERDENIFSEDCVGYFIMPDTSREVMYQIYCTPLGTIYDAILEKNTSGLYQGKTEWNCEMEWVVNLNDDCWIFEARIPISQLNCMSLESGKVMLLNFRRKQPCKEAYADWQTPIDFDPETFGLLHLE